MKIAIVGTKGIPAKYGGFETFAFQLAKHFALNGHVVTVVNEKGNLATTFDFPVNIIYSKYKKSKNPLLFYKQSLHLVSQSNSVVLVCGVGGAAFYSIQNGNAIIVTNVDGLEHLRGKYSFLQRKFVFILQILASIFSEHLIADSDEVKKYWNKRFKRAEGKLSAIAYGAEMPTNFDESVLDDFEISVNDYYLVVARLVPENNLQMILESFKNYNGTKKLIVVGDRKDNPFAISISDNSDNRVKFVGSLYEKGKLDSLRKNSFAYIHGHSVGGTNPALLEAMVCKCVCLCHSNVFNKEVTDNQQLYFQSAFELIELFSKLENNISLKNDLSNRAYKQVTENYSWLKIAEQYEDLFSELIRNKRG